MLSGLRKKFNKIPTFARECDHYNVSNSAGAAIATATLIDYGIITPNDTSLIIDRCKLRRQREKLRTQLCEDTIRSLSEKGPTALFFLEEKTVHFVTNSLAQRGILTKNIMS